MKFHNKDGSVKWMKIYWIYFFVVIVPITISGFFVEGDLDKIQNIAYVIAWIPPLLFLVTDMITFRRKMRRQRHEFEQRQKWFDEQFAALYKAKPGKETTKKAAEIMDKLNEGRDREV